MESRQLSAPIADIFNQSFKTYHQNNGPLPPEYYKVANAIMKCRTDALGGHIYQCCDCDYELTLYNSCRNRHCPTCQAFSRMRWVEARMEQFLPTPYFHVVFTLPSQLRQFFQRNRKICYGLFFKAVAATLQDLAHDSKHLGGTIGFICVLHTWTQKLLYHPHIHCIVPAGALSPDNTRWIHCRKDFLFPFAVMKKLFRGKLMAYFKNAVKAGDIKLDGPLQRFADKKTWRSFLDQCYSMEWVIYAKESFDNPQRVIKYLGAYTHRIAISNKRIEAVTDKSVRFTYEDRQDNNAVKSMEISPHEFIRRFMMHVVPSGFMRIRHYGFLSNRSQKTLLPIIMEILEAPQKEKRSFKGAHWYEVIEALTGNDPTLCPQCGKGKLRVCAEIPKAGSGFMSAA